MSRLSRQRPSGRRAAWKGLRLIFAGGLLLQTATTTGCNEVLANATAGLTTSIVNQFIRNVVNQALGLDSTGINF